MNTEFVIELRAHDAWVLPTLPPSITQALTASVRHFQLGLDGIAVRHVVEIQFAEAVTGMTWVPAGLATRVMHLLSSQGYSVKLRNRTTWAVLRSADRAQLERPGLDPQDAKLIHALLEHPRGQIWVEGDRTAAHAISVLCCVFPESPIFIAVSTKRSVRELARQISRLNNRPIQTTLDDAWRVPNRVYVGTGSGFAQASSHDFDIFVFADVWAAIGRKSFANAKSLKSDLFYCIRRPHEPLDHYQQLRLESICGPVIWDDRGTEQQELPRVLFAAVPVRPIRLGKLDPLERKKRGIWHNEIRNRAVAAIAEAFSSGNIETLWSYGLLLKEPQAGALAGGLRTVILVEGPEHGRELITLLPDWELLSRGADAGSPDEDGCISLPTFPSERAVVTEAYAEQYGIWADVVIQAQGTFAAWRPSWGRGGCDKGTGIFVVDFFDDADEHARQQTLRRTDWYLRNGFPVEGYAAARRGAATGSPTRGGEERRE